MPGLLMEVHHLQNVMGTEVLPGGICPKMVTAGETELFTLMDCVVGPWPVGLDVKVHIITPKNTVWLCALSPALILHPLLISDSRVLVCQVSSMNTCTLPRGDTMLLVSQTQRWIEVQSEKAGARALQTVWVINPHQVIKLWVILAEGAGATRMYYWKVVTPLFSSSIAGWLVVLCNLALEAHAQDQHVNT